MATTRKVGLKIEVDGEKEYKSAIADLNRGNQVLASELRKVQEQYKGNENSIEALNAKGDVLQRQLLQQQDKVQTLRAALQNAANEYGEADRRTQEWQIKLNNAETAQVKLERAIDENNDAIQAQEGALERAGDAVGGLGDQLDGLASQFGVNIPDAAKGALNEIDGFSASAVADFSAVAGGAAAVIKVTQELWDLTKQAAADADALLTRSAQTGLSTDLLQQLDYAQRFLDFDGIDKSLQRLTQSMGNATTAGSKQAAAFRELGVEIYDTDGKLRNNYDVFLDAIDALGAMEDETRRDILANQLFGKSYAELKPLIEAGSGALKQYTDRAQKMGYVIDEAVIKKLGRFDDALQENGVAMKTAATELAGFFAPIFETATEIGTGAINVTRKVFSSDIGQAILSVGSPLYDFISTLSLVTDKYQEVKDSQEELADSSDTSAQKMTAATTTMQESVQALAEKYREAQEKYKDMLDGQFGLFEDASERLVSDSDAAAEKLAEFWQNAYDSAEKSIQGQFGLLDFARTSYQQFADEYAKSWGSTFQTVKSSVEGVWGTYEEAVGFSMKTAQEMDTAYDSQKHYWEWYDITLKQVLSSGIEGVREWATATADGSKESAAALGGFLNATEEGRQIIVDSFSRMKDAETEAADAITDLKTRGSLSMEEYATFMQEKADETISAQQSQLDYWTEYEENLEALWNSGIEGIQAYVQANSDGSAKSVEAIAVMTAANEEQKEKILSTYQALEDKQAEVAQTSANMATAVAESTGEFAENAQQTVGDMIAAADSQAEYFEQYEADLNALHARGIQGVEVLEKNLLDGSEASKNKLAELRTASDEEIEKLIASMGRTEDAKNGLATRMADLAVDVPKELQKIATEFDNTVLSINTEAGQVNFAPFKTSVDEAFSFLEDRAGNSVSTVRGWLGELSREIDAVEARAANVRVGHNAGGTDYWQGGPTYLAENGPELVELPKGSQVHTAQETRQILGQSTDTREMEAKLGQTVSLLGQIAAELAGLKVRGRMA